MISVESAILSTYDRLDPDACLECPDSGYEIQLYRSWDWSRAEKEAGADNVVAPGGYSP